MCVGGGLRAEDAVGYGYAVLNIVVDVLGVIITKLHGVGLGTWEINLIRYAPLD